MNEYPKISIVTPSYNQGRFLEETIQSVLNQNYPNLEYIIIDGGSSDNSVEIIKKYENNLAYWVSEKDRGQTHAINKGLKRATGHIIAYLNSDDVYLPRCLEKVANFFNNNSEIDIVYGDCHIINEVGESVKKKKEIHFDYLMGCFIGFGLIIIQPSTFMRRGVVEKVGYFTEDFHFAMDSDYWFRCAQKGIRFRHMPHFLSGFRWHDDSKTKSSSNDISPKKEQEKQALINKAYNTLMISRIIPFEYSKIIRTSYRVKRVMIKLFKGCYI